MSALLNPDQIVYTDTSFKPCIVKRLLGSGGQGEVYCALRQGVPVALKWYFPHQATIEQRRAIQTLIRLGPPNNRFLWPMEMVSIPGKPGFGYLMPLRDPRCKSIIDLMKRRAEPSFHTLITACIELTHSFLQLHSKGLCYRDVSFGNVFFNVETGAILICDNDNVAINGEKRSGVMGTPRFMAPEVVRDEADPDTQTDLFSLSVLLFYLLLVHHPLEGEKENEIKCLDFVAMKRLYGEDPLFIFDPKDSSNFPVIGLHDNAIIFWNLYPRNIRRLFTRAFTEGLHHPERRVRESEWRSALGVLRDSIIVCECGEENFHCSEKSADRNGNPGLCWSCNQLLTVPLSLKAGRSRVMLNPNTCLYRFHLTGMGSYDFTEPIGRMNQNPMNPSQWGIKNMTQSDWTMLTPEGSARTVPPGKSFPLEAGVKVDFGETVGEIIEEYFDWQDARLAACA